MEDVRTVLVDVDAFVLFAINIAAELRTFIDDET
jgi:hypothetical protein